jgi:hypothetical protein
MSLLFSGRRQSMSGFAPPRGSVLTSDRTWTSSQRGRHSMRAGWPAASAGRAKIFTVASFSRRAVTCAR